jgi:predicted nucleic acid-binding protein
MRSALRGFLVDSNVLIYAHDASDRVKQARALQVLDRLIDQKLAVLSVQCLSEFFNSVSLRIPQPLTERIALSQVEHFTRSCRVLELTPTAVIDGCRGSIQHQMSIWDALIWSVARLNGISWILTEDGQHNRLIEGVRYLNPFHPDFDLQLLEPPA